MEYKDEEILKKKKKSNRQKRNQKQTKTRSQRHRNLFMMRKCILLVLKPILKEGRYLN